MLQCDCIDLNGTHENHVLFILYTADLSGIHEIVLVYISSCLPRC